MPPVGRSQIEAHEIHRSKGLENTHAYPYIIKLFHMEKDETEIHLQLPKKKDGDNHTNSKMNELSDPSFFPTETGRVDNVERESPRAGASDVLRVYSDGIWWHRALNPGLPVWSPML
ncbi:hypothetical protein TNCV_991711 [Trichonephila clavipes]|nr:hypothetical protein TNCV_991711 [Trichonephila clavipes]